MRKLRVMVRLVVDGRQVSAEPMNIDIDDPSQIQTIAEQHAKTLAQTPGLIEIEFLDETDINQRFFRIGTDPRWMVNPVRIA